jgi:hypothetical protein
MSDLSNILPNRRNSALYNSSYEFQQEVDRQEKIDREELSIKLQIDLTKRLQDLEATLQKQRETDRQEKAKDRVSDRKLLWKIGIWCALIGAIMGGIVAKLFDIFLK